MNKSIYKLLSINDQILREDVERFKKEVIPTLPKFVGNISIESTAYDNKNAFYKMSENTSTI